MSTPWAGHHEHEWTPEPDTPPDDRTAFTCRHCDATTVQCASCHRPLTAGETHACHVCVGRMRGTLARITHLHALLPTALRTIEGVDYRRGPARPTAERPMPGGDALVMLAGGSGSSVTPDRHGRRSPQDQHPTDPPSITGVLADMEDAWRHALHQPAAPYLPSVTNAAHFLRRHVQWAADNHHGWDSDLTTLTDITRRMEHLLGEGPDEEVLPAPCPHCGGRIVRRWTTPTPRGGGATEWTCQQCGASTTLTGVLQALDDNHQLPAAAIAHVLGVSAWTVRSWRRRGKLTPTATTHEHLYRLGDARALTRETP